MKLSKSLADKIVKKTVELTQLNINVMDTMGMILSSSDPQRIESFHAGAFEVIQSGEEMMISSENYSHFEGTKPGINMPIFFQDRAVGVIGISGQPDEVIPFARGVRMMTEMLLQEEYLTKQLVTEERSKDYLIQEIISGEHGADPDSLEGLITRGELLGVDLTRLTEVKQSTRELLIQEALGELIHHPELMTTLQGFFECNMNISLAAETLMVHRNTLLYRLEKIEGMIKRNPRSFQDAVHIQLALKLYSLSR